MQGALYSSMLVGLMHSSTAAKEKKNYLLIPLKTSVKVSFVTPCMGNMGKMVGDYQFLPFIHSILANYIDV